MEDSVARWSPLRTKALESAAEAEQLRVAAKDLERVVSGPGWQYVLRWLASHQQASLTYLLRPPGNDRADTYALKKAHAAGFLDALEHIVRTPDAVREIAKQVALAQQQAAEAAEEA